jgi:hypothetical protein
LFYPNITYVALTTILDSQTPVRSNVTSTSTKSAGTYKKEVSVNLHRKSLEEYFLIFEDVTDLGRQMAVTQPFESPIFESRLQPGLHPHAIKTIFFEVISTVMKHEFMDVNLPSTPGHTYGHVIEDTAALIFAYLHQNLRKKFCWSLHRQSCSMRRCTSEQSTSSI